MIVTGADMYTAVQDGINKEKTGSIFPDEFERLINRNQMKYIKLNLLGEETTQKKIDDLREIKVISAPIPPTVVLGKIFPLPYNPAAAAPFLFGYLYMLTASFSITYVANKCGFTGVSSHLIAKPMKTVFKNYIDKDPYNRPTDERLYYEIVGDFVTLINNTPSTGVSAIFEYLRYPATIHIDPLTGPIQDCELAISARQEICRLAVLDYLEEIADTRYQTNLNEIKNEGL